MSDDIAFVALARSGARVEAIGLDAAGLPVSRVSVAPGEVGAWVRAAEGEHAPRWVWGDAGRWYPALLAEGVRVARCHDLRLCHAILRASTLVRSDDAVRLPGRWDAPPAAELVAAATEALFDLDERETPVGVPDDAEAVVAELQAQLSAVSGSTAAGSLRLLLAAESAGALIAAEMRAAGLPWDASAHDALLSDVLGARPAPGRLPQRLEESAGRVRAALGDPAASLDSQPKLLRSLHRAGVLVESTSKWELSHHSHPAIEPLLEYKRLARLMSANGWAWLDEWVHDGRFRPVYVPGGVVTGRWASSGGGALQIPRQLRTAVRADPGWVLVVADVAQLEPRVLAAMARDERLAEAARGRDLYAGIVDSGAVATRQEAKIAMLGAMYGATTGDSGRLVPRLRRTFPRAMGLVDEAARVGEDGGTVSTWLGRSSPAVDDEWVRVQARATEADAGPGDVTRARRWARDRGRFTRNFVVQGTAAEWALAWLADARTRFAAMPAVADGDAAHRSGSVAARHPHLAFFLHDEIIVHAPATRADEVVDAIRDAAASAGRLLFGSFPLDFPLDVRVAATATKD